MYVSVNVKQLMYADVNAYVWSAKTSFINMECELSDL